MKDYAEARAAAQKTANATGMDVGLELNPIFKTWSTRLLPRRENRRGHELRCALRALRDLVRTAPPSKQRDELMSDIDRAERTGSVVMGG